MLLADDAGRGATDGVGAVITHRSIRLRLGAGARCPRPVVAHQMKLLHSRSHSTVVIGLGAVVIVSVGTFVHKAIQCAHLGFDLLIQLCVDLLQAERKRYIYVLWMIVDALHC